MPQIYPNLKYNFMIDFKETFYQTLETRNARQLQAIHAIEGPVMVIAGPGTGKTDVLGLRIGNILEKTQIGIHNILCLTYTEAGAVEMRKRLLQYIGPTAYNGQIFTFHGFCNMVIHENPGKFNIYRDAQPVSELEQFQIFKEIIDELPLNDPLKRHTGNIYYESRRLKNLFDAMKLEHWSPQFMYESIVSFIEKKQTDPRYIYKTSKAGKYQRGDRKTAHLNKEVYQPMELLKAAVDTFPKYNNKLKERGRYDYHDMLTWVFETFNEDEDLLREYQERYQYFLIDEFQDSNGIQLNILKLLASYWERPDLFIVGDDDQSIFRFQGANMHNITSFKEEFDPQIIILTDNYRSSQQILDAAATLIDRNEERLVKQFPEYEKNLQAKGVTAGLDISPAVHVFPNETQEQAALLAELDRLQREDILEQESVAVIYRKHRQVENLLHAMEVRGIPILVKRPVNILYRPIVRNILTILQYVSNEVNRLGSGEHLLFEILHYQFFGINAVDAGQVALFCRKRKSENPNIWRETISSEKLLKHIQVSNVDGFLKLSNLLDDWISNYAHYTIQEMLEQIMTRGGVLQYIFSHPNRTWHFQLVKTLFDHVKMECRRKPDLRIREFLRDINLMQEHGIELPVHKTMRQKSGVHFVTAHSAKGMEFDRVFMFGCTTRIWDNQRGGYGDKFKMPELYTVADDATDEDERRLFYVGITRARKQLTMSYAELDDQERELESSRFIQEILQCGINSEQVSLSENVFAEYSRDLMRPIESSTPLVDSALIDQVLENFEMSVSVLNKYLECPRKYYFENILRVPQAQKKYFGYGNAIHGALDTFFKLKVDDRNLLGDADDLVSMFLRQMKKNRSFFTEQEYEGHLHEGQQILRSYFEHRSREWIRPEQIRSEHRISNKEFNGVPIKGNLDRIDIYPDQVIVTDYKTGKASNAAKTRKFDRPSESNQKGGHYWRQIVFYKILIDADPEFRKKMSVGNIDFVQLNSKGLHDLKKITVTQEDIDGVGEQMTEVYEKIMNHAFHEGCGECYWCEVVQNKLVVDADRLVPEEVDEYSS